VGGLYVREVLGIRPQRFLFSGYIIHRYEIQTDSPVINHHPVDG